MNAFLRKIARGLSGERGPKIEDDSEEIKTEEKEFWEEELEEEKIISMYETEKTKLNPEDKRNIEKYLNKDWERRIASFTVDRWLPEHKENFEEKGINVKNLSHEEKVNLGVKEAYVDLKTNSDYKEDYEKMKDFLSIKKSFKKEKISIEDKLLALNILKERREAVKKDMETADKEGDNILRDEKENEFKEIFDLNLKLAKNISGRNLEREAEKEFPLEKKDEYLKNRLKNKLVTEWDDKWLKQNKDKKLGDLTKEEKEERKNHIVSEMSNNEKYKEDIKIFEENWVKKRQGDINKRLETKLETLSTPSGGKEQIKELYKEVRNKVVAEYLSEKKLPKEIKQFEKQKEILEEKGVDTIKFISEIYNKKGLEKLKGDWKKKDREQIIGFLDDRKIASNSKELKTFFNEKPQRKKEMRTKRGYLYNLLDFIFTQISKKEKE